MNWKFWKKADKPKTTDVVDATLPYPTPFQPANNRPLGELLQEALEDQERRAAPGDSMSIPVLDAVPARKISRVEALAKPLSPPRKASQPKPKPQEPAPWFPPDIPVVPYSGVAKTARNNEIKRRHRNGETIAELAAAYGLSGTRIYQITGRWRPDYPDKVVSAADTKLAQEYRAIKSLKKLAARHNISVATVRNRLFKAGEKINAPGRRKRVKAPEKLRMKLAQAHLSGVPKPKVAEKFGVSVFTVHRAVQKYAAEAIGVHMTWDDEKIGLLKELWPKKDWTTEQMGELLGVSSGAIRMKARRLDLPPRRVA